jgi:1,4-alpha-glucan branching enzyme
MIFDDDKYLEPYRQAITGRYQTLIRRKQEIAGYGKKLSDAVNNHLYYILHKEGSEWVFREWAPNATELYLIGDFNDWKKSKEFSFSSLPEGNWELRLPEETISHGCIYKYLMVWPGGSGERIPSYADRCVQDPQTKIFSAQVWAPARKYRWKNDFIPSRSSPFIYETHIGMSSEGEKVSGFNEFREKVLPYVASLGYNTLQIMALQEHPYYGSFGYQVSNFYALSSRFGTPEEFKRLVDDAHKMGISVIMDIVHSHAVKNEIEGLGRFDGSDCLYFHSGERGMHPAWNSRCFDYGKDAVLFFLLSNLKYWMQEYHLDGFRFDGVTSMIYLDHGLGKDFTDYSCYFDGNQDVDALTYLGLANILVKEINSHSITIAEDMSGMPGLAAPISKGGFGFDYRMSMGIADHWIKWIKELRDEEWSMGGIYYELTNKRGDEKTISYAECHDQAMVGDKTIIFRLMDKEMYFNMNKSSKNIIVERGMALHKMIRLITAATAGDGYLTFMGNEFGHPEWIDFPREGNGWSYFYARRQWSLKDNPLLRYKSLLEFDSAMIHLLKKGNVLKTKPFQLYVDEMKKVLIFGRGCFIFAFNFNPSLSFTDYRFGAPPGEYETMLDSDSLPFDGFGRNIDTIRHFTDNVNGKDELSLYLPSRTAIVLKKLTR